MNISTHAEAVTIAVSMEELTSEHTLAQAALSYVLFSDQMQQRGATWETRNAEKYKSLANSELGQKTLGSIEKRFLHLWKCAKRKEGLASGSINGQISTLRNVFNWLTSLEIVKNNPTNGLERAARTPKRRLTRALTAAEVNKVTEMLEKVRTYRAKKFYAEYWQLLCESGMRAGELRQITVDDLRLDFNPPVVIVRSEISKSNFDREAVVSAKAKAILLAVIAEKKLTSGAIFGLSRWQFPEVLNRAMHDGKCEHVFQHLARHTALSNYAAKATSLKELQSFSGHRSVAGAAPYLVHDMRELQSVVAEKLNS